ncbi:hypothetical protein TWF730_003763 [Orbilia blumenaviensis]|uniref:Nucleoside phosphorylase domain-containing protein n=1 Tax=Orbilia blumenaviensis TaxID=1796055 RepID=A0AAV9U383_9PEZI
MPSNDFDSRVFDIAILCALPVEAKAVAALIEDKHFSNSNGYTIGRIHSYKVVLAHMGGMGKVEAAETAAKLQSDFIGIKVALLVGICGGVPVKKDGMLRLGREMVLGDVVISAEIVRYDFGKRYPNAFELKCRIEGSNEEDLQSNINVLQSDEKGLQSDEDGLQSKDTLKSLLSELEVLENIEKFEGKMHEILKDLQEKLHSSFRYPKGGGDILFKSSYGHKHDPGLCPKCNPSDLMFIVPKPRLDPICEESLLACQVLGCGGDTEIIPRNRLKTGIPQPIVHVGRVGSGDTVIKSGKDRDEIANPWGIIAFEMEAAGIWNILPCSRVIIKGVCDYADSHKSKDFQGYAAATAAAAMSAFLAEWALIDGPGLAPLIDHHPVWSVPYSRNTNFIGRELLIQKIEKVIIGNSRGLSTIAMFGIRGIGKTEIAIELAYQISRNHPPYSVLWFASNDARDFREKKKGVSHPNKSAKKVVDPDSLANTFQHFPRLCLMILDDVDGDDYSALVNYAPTEGGTVLLITRSEQAAAEFSPQHVFGVYAMENTDAEKMLCQLLTSTRCTEDLECVYNARTLSERLAYHPLAIAQAAGYLNRHPEYSINGYLALLDGIELSPSTDQTQADPVKLTLSLSFDDIYGTKQNDGIHLADLLSLISYLNPKNIPCEILHLTGSQNHEISISVLLSLSFIRRRTDDSFDVHYLVHNYARKRLEQDTERANKAAAGLSLFLSDPAHDNDDSWSKYLPHLEHVMITRNYYGFQSRKFVGKYGLKLMRNGDYINAANVLEKAADMEKAALGPRHINTLCAISNLGMAYEGQNNLNKAENKFKAVLIVAERIWGVEGSFTMRVSADLVAVYIKMRKWTMAEELLMRMTKAKETKLGPNHLETLTSMAYLACIHQQQGRLRDAAGLLEHVMKQREIILGRNHPDTLCSMKQLAICRKEMGENHKAIVLLGDSLKMQEQALAPHQSLSSKAVTLWKRWMTGK